VHGHDDPRAAALAVGYQFLLNAAARGDLVAALALPGRACSEGGSMRGLSTEAQADRGTIGSQLQLLRQRVGFRPCGAQCWGWRFC
jgi:hypothetical protein